MTQYAPITFTKLSEAIAYLEDGGELYQMDAGQAYEISESALLSCWRDPLFTKQKPAPWYEKLDGTLENGVLCRVVSHEFGFSTVAIVVEKDSGTDHPFCDSSNSNWEVATPLTRAEIQKFMDNAPEEVK